MAFAGKVALVTGGASGMGRLSAQRLAAAAPPEDLRAERTVIFVSLHQNDIDVLDPGDDFRQRQVALHFLNQGEFFVR